MKPSQIPKEKKVFVRMSSQEGWLSPGDDQIFAELSNDQKQFRAKIRLNQFSSFDENEINIHVHKYDLQICATRDNPHNPDRPRVLNRQYRLPCDIDLKTLSLKRSYDEVNVKANKIPSRGLLIGLSIVDATASGQKVTRVKAF